MTHVLKGRQCAGHALPTEGTLKFALELLRAGIPFPEVLDVREKPVWVSELRMNLGRNGMSLVPHNRPESQE